MKKLDPLGLGKIDFKQFAIGMRKLTSGELDGPDDDINHSKPANKSVLRLLQSSQTCLVLLVLFLVALFGL